MHSTPVEPKIESGWKARLLPEFQTPSFAGLKKFLLEERRAGHSVYPPGSRIFAAFDNTPWDQVKVVIIGQDPYHGPGQANGLCFSVAPDIPKPPSLLNIFKELQDDLGCPLPEQGDLTPWARQGVLLLNAMLTVRAREAASHQGKGWEAFTDAVIRTIVEEKEHVVFLLWGRYAQNKARMIDLQRHAILEAPHPSPLSSHRGFFGCKHFSRTNEQLEAWGMPPIYWAL